MKDIRTYTTEELEEIRLRVNAEIVRRRVIESYPQTILQQAKTLIDNGESLDDLKELFRAIETEIENEAKKLGGDVNSLAIK